MTPEDIIQMEAENLVRLSLLLGVNVEITNHALKPLAMGHTAPRIEVWPKRQPAEVVQPAVARPGVFGYLDGEVRKDMAGFYEAFDRPQPPPPAPRPMSDREWAAQPANMREGCTVRIPGVGEI